MLDGNDYLDWALYLGGSILGFEAIVLAGSVPGSATFMFELPFLDDDLGRVAVAAHQAIYIEDICLWVVLCGVCVWQGRPSRFTIARVPWLVRKDLSGIRQLVLIATRSP